MSSDLINLSFYRFVSLTDLHSLRVSVYARCAELGLMGTILLAPEGMNAGVTGVPAAIEAFKGFVQDQFGVAVEDFKQMQVSAHSYKRLLVKLKKEIITLGLPEVRPDLQTGKRLSAEELKQWLDEKRPMLLLDTRNRYEIEVGTFAGAVDLGHETFKEFGERVKTSLQDTQEKAYPIVTFCTGGIRCEKASALLMQQGFQDVYQLEGGILRYFEKNGAAHFNGNCFVFDWRLAVDGGFNAVPRSADPLAEHGRHYSL